MVKTGISGMVLKDSQKQRCVGLQRSDTSSNFHWRKTAVHFAYHDIITEDDRILQYLKATLGRACSNEVEDRLWRLVLMQIIQAQSMIEDPPQAISRSCVETLFHGGIRSKAH